MDLRGLKVTPGLTFCEAVRLFPQADCSPHQSVPPSSCSPIRLFSLTDCSPHQAVAASGCSPGQAVLPSSLFSHQTVPPVRLFPQQPPNITSPGVCALLTQSCSKIRVGSTDWPKGQPPLAPGGPELLFLLQIGVDQVTTPSISGEWAWRQRPSMK